MCIVYTASIRRLCPRPHSGGQNCAIVDSGNRHFQVLCVEDHEDLVDVGEDLDSKKEVEIGVLSQGMIPKAEVQVVSW